MKAKLAENNSISGPSARPVFHGMCLPLQSLMLCCLGRGEFTVFLGNSLELQLEHIELLRHSIDKGKSGYFKFGAQPGAVYGQVGLAGMKFASVLQLPWDTGMLL